MLVTTLFIYSTYFFRRNKKVLPITTPDDGKGTEVASNEEAGDGNYKKEDSDQSVKPSQAEPTVPGASGAEAQTEVKV